MALPPDPATTKPVAKPAAPIGKPTKPPAVKAAGAQPTLADLYATLTQQPSYAAQQAAAAKQANASVAGQVAYITQLQQQALAQARQRALDITGASGAAAKLLIPLGGQAADAYQAAENAQTGMAQGFTGQLRADAEAQALAAQQTAQAAGGSAAQVPDVSGSLANLLYGLSGKIPGDQLAVQGLGALRDAQTLPAQTLGYGQQEAAGALGAGQQAAQQLVAELVRARGELPGLTADNLAGLQKSAQDSLTNRREALGTLSLIQARDAAAQAATRRGDIAEFNANTARAAADARAAQAAANAQSLADYRAGRLSIDELRTQVYATAQATSAKIRQAQLGISRTNAATSVFNANTSRINAGTSARRADIAAAAARTKAAAAKASGGLSASSYRVLVSDATKQAKKLATRTPAKQTYDSYDNKWVTEPGSGTEAIPYRQALAQIMALGPATPAWAKKALQIVNAQYPPGVNGRPLSRSQQVAAAKQAARIARANGVPTAEIVRQALAHGIALDVILRFVPSEGVLGYAGQ